jgi:hypothetical protein
VKDDALGGAVGEPEGRVEVEREPEVDSSVDMLGF